MIDRTDDSTWTATAAWGAVTTVLIVVTLTLDPLWAYFGSWAAGFMTAFSAIRAWIVKEKRRRLDSEDEALFLEVRQGKTTEGERYRHDLEH